MIRQLGMIAVAEHEVAFVSLVPAARTIAQSMFQVWVS